MIKHSRKLSTSQNRAICIAQKNAGTLESKINLRKKQHEQSMKRFHYLPEASQDAMCKQFSGTLKQSMDTVNLT